MALSQNVRFAGTAPLDEEFDHPPGASIARLLQTSLAQAGWNVSPFDNWRDSGWSIQCEGRGSKQEVVLAPMAAGSEWMLQIAPTYVPGLIGLLLGKSATASAVQVFELARVVHSILGEQGGFAEFKWCWGGYPDDGDSTSEPVPLQE